MSAFYFVASAIIFTACISILCLIFVPKIRASMKQSARVEKRSYPVRGHRRTSSSGGDGESCGIKILSSPVAIEKLEQENCHLKHFVVGSGRRLSSVLNDEEAGSDSRRLSHMSSIVESDAVTEKEKLETVGSSNNGDVDVENHTKMNADDIE